MKIIGLNGSPNKDGNTKYLLNNVMGNLKILGAETQIIDVGEVLKDQKIPFCTVCSNPCTGMCYKGTALEEAYKLITKADGVVFGSPVYFGTVSAQLKAFIDKARKLRGDKGLYNKVGAGVTVGAAKYGGQETTIKAIHDMMLVQGMIIVGDGYIENDCGHHGVCAQKSASEDDFSKVRSEILAKRIYEVCNATMQLRQK